MDSDNVTTAADGLEAKEPEARELIRRLVEEAKMTPQSISEALDDRVSSRTVYRWMKGECVPHQPGDLKALKALVERVLTAK